MQSISQPLTVLCAQIGARDHYAIARAFRHAGLLGGLLTDYWQEEKPSLPGAFFQRASGRHHPDLDGIEIASCNMRTLWRGAGLRMRGATGWRAVIAHNNGFQKDALHHLRRMTKDIEPGTRVALFSYSYAARDLFLFARDQGWATLLGQIDPGPEEGRLVQELKTVHPDWQCTREQPPPGYYESWHKEATLADRIVVNSEWSAGALRRHGVDVTKIAVVPIPYDPPPNTPARNEYPAVFSAVRPLRLLFLGQVNLRKGICELIEAMGLLIGLPVELTIVGEPQVAVPPQLRALPSLRWTGPVPRGEASARFLDADVFILPTHSDGFGLTQLEALAHRLPVIVSQNCAHLVDDDVQGRVLPEVSAAAIANTLREILDNPPCLARWSANCQVPEQCQPQAVATQLRSLVEAL